MSIENIRERIHEIALAEGEGLHRDEAIFRTLTEIVAEAGFLTSPQWTPARWKADGHQCSVEGYDIDEDDNVLTVFALIDSHAHLDLDRNWVAITCQKREIERAQRELLAAVEAIEHGHAPDLDLSDPANDLIRSLQKDYRPADGRVACCILTTGRLTSSGAVATADSDVRMSVWDSERLVRASENGREPLIADFTDIGGLPALVSEREVADIEAGRVGVLIAKVPGGTLAHLYNRFRMRLLERNVRAFLQFTGKVNKGIRTTIHEEPERFLSYNNGISATASAVNLRRGSDGFYHLLTAHDFQIVNGGQTTASIARCVREDGVDVSATSVVMKLTVVPELLIDDLVPRISRFSNTQNRIQDADFFANSPWHIALERHSRTTEAERDAESAGQPFYWFYERVRGQYADELAKFGTKAQKNSFRARHPARAKFTKTDLARYVLSWEQEPHTVSLGGQKAFVRLMHVLGASGADAEGGQLPSEEDFRRICCLALLQKQGERISRELDIVGYRANLVAYAMAVISVGTDRRLPWRRMWTDQELPPEVDRALRIAIPACDRLIRESAGPRNVSEWAKKLECREHVLAGGIEVRLQPASDWVQFSVRDMARPKQVADLNKLLLKVGSAGWRDIADAVERDGSNKTVWAGVARTYADKYVPAGRSPSDKQAKILIKALKKYRDLRRIAALLGPEDIALLGAS